MEDRETPRMHKCRESKTTQIMMATVRHVTSSSGLRKLQANDFFGLILQLSWFNVLAQAEYIANITCDLLLYGRRG